MTDHSFSRREALEALALGGVGAALLAACGGTTKASPAVAQASSAATTGATTASSGVTSSTVAGSTASTAASTAAPPSSSAAVAAAGCVLTPEATEGPYWIDGMAMRHDITEGKPGAPLDLALTVINAKTCAPVPNAAVELWHCDASGVYSGFGTNVTKERFLRGTQVVDANGVASLRTIYPGWYPGRPIHIHLKVHAGGHVTHTGQLFFDEAMSDKVMALDAYKGHRGKRTLNNQDGIFSDAGGATAIATVTPVSVSDLSKGFTGTLTLVIDPDATPPNG
jgi:protocatechuate 3,4-dioxygenase beta subunit